MGAKYLVNCSTVFADVAVLRQAAAARDAGFDAVEFWWPFRTAVPSAAELDRFERSVTEAGVQVMGIGLFAGDAAADRGILSTPGMSATFRANFDVAAELGRRLGVRSFTALYGNSMSGVSAAQHHDVAFANLAYAESVAGLDGAVVLLEPLSGVERYPLRTAIQVVHLLERLEAEGVHGVGMLADLYHLAVNGDNVGEVIDSHLARIWHVQLADSPGRGVPGTGDLPIRAWIDALVGAGYRGYFGLEYFSQAGDRFDWIPRASRGLPEPAHRFE